MNSFGDEKRKNDNPRRFPWQAALFLVIGFALGVFVTLLVVPSRIETVSYMSDADFARSEISSVQPVPGQDDFSLTATYIIQQATQMAGGVFSTPLPVQPSGDSLYATATKIIQNATETVQAAMTATAAS